MKEYDNVTVIDLADLSRFIEFPNPVRGKKILDIGAGVSTAPAELEKLGARAYAVDLQYADLPTLKDKSEKYLQDHHGFYRQNSLFSPSQQEYLDHQTQKFPQLKKQFMEDVDHAPGKYIAARADNLPFRDDVFDFVYSVRCLNYFTHDEELFHQCISEALRVLKPGGELQISPFAPDRMTTQAMENVRKIAHIQQNEGHKATLLQYPQAPYMIFSITRR